MALIAETIVEEYHNYLGYFTIRGVKKGSDEMDLLAIKVSNKNKIEALHIEVQVSHKPVRYISDFIAELHVAGRSTSHAANRTEEELRQCCQAGSKRNLTIRVNRPCGINSSLTSNGSISLFTGMFGAERNWRSLKSLGLKLWILGLLSSK
jgi:hypothetical protein